VVGKRNLQQARYVTSANSSPNCCTDSLWREMRRERGRAGLMVYSLLTRFSNN